MAQVHIASSRRARGDKDHIGGAHGKGGGTRNKSSQLTMYSEPPTEEITLLQLETLAVNRLEVLKKLEDYRAKGYTQEQAASATRELLKRYDMLDSMKDRLSHFILRLAYCRSETLRRWFLAQECALFRLRFLEETNDGTQLFFARHKMDYTPIPVDEYERLKDAFAACTWNGQCDTEYFKVPFEEALELFQRRQCYLENGFAYVGRKDLVSIVVSKFRAYVSRQLAATHKTSQNLKQDQRLRPILNGLEKQYIGTSYVPALAGGVTRQQVPELAHRSFPMCMQHSYQHLKDDGHLKHGGRMQLSLFLKGIGLSLAEALVMWKQMFAKKTPPEEFDKRYAYNLRHNYGKEGKRTQYTPYGCRKIIMAQPGFQDYHGCPFKAFDERALRMRLSQKKIKKSDIDDIIAKVQHSHYQVACQKVFQLTHENTVPEEAINHPNSYFDESVKFHTKKAEAANAGAAKKATDGSGGAGAVVTPTK